MRKTFRLLPFILSIALITTIVSCSKEGPAGPAGAAGPAGPAGPSGPAGPAGAPGTANVIYSNWLDVTYSKQYDTTNGIVDSFYAAAITAPKLDTAILNRGEIKVYWNLGSSVNPLVFTLPYGYDILPFFEKGFIDLQATFNASSATQSGVKVGQYRYILIPGGTTARMASTVNWNDYKSVQAYLGLKD